MIRCPACDESESRTKGGLYDHPRNGYFRKRKCKRCGETFVTLESLSPSIKFDVKEKVDRRKKNAIEER